MSIEVPANSLLVTADEAAGKLAICRKTLWNWTQPRGPIPSVKSGSAVRYSVASLEKFIAERKAAK